MQKVPWAKVLGPVSLDCWHVWVRYIESWIDRRFQALENWFVSKFHRLWHLLPGDTQRLWSHERTSIQHSDVWPIDGQTAFDRCIIQEMAYCKRMHSCWWRYGKILNIICKCMSWNEKNGCWLPGNRESRKSTSWGVHDCCSDQWRANVITTR